MKFSGFKYLVGEGVENIWRNRVMSFASFCVLMVSILIVGITTLFYLNVNSVIGFVAEKNEVIVYIDDGTSSEDIKKLKSDIESTQNVTDIEFYSKEQAFKDLKSQMSGTDYDVLFDSLGDDNPLIDAYRLRIKDINHMDETVSRLKDFKNVLSVRAPYDFVSILTQPRRIVSIIALTAIIALIIVSFIVTYNTIKASVFSRRSEIQIQKYVGATNAFIRIPFFVEGMITGLFAGIVAFILTWLSYDSIVGILTNQVPILNINTMGGGSLLTFRELAVPVAVGYLVSGAVIGALGSTLSTRKHIDV